jgi:hypothetical protein
MERKPETGAGRLWLASVVAVVLWVVAVGGTIAIWVDPYPGRVWVSVVVTMLYVLVAAAGLYQLGWAVDRRQALRELNAKLDAAYASADREYPLWVYVNADHRYGRGRDWS